MHCDIDVTWFIHRVLFISAIYLTNPLLIIGIKQLLISQISHYSHADDRIFVLNSIALTHVLLKTLLHGVCLGSCIGFSNWC